MQKPYLLRDHIVSSIPYLQRNPDKLIMFIEDGHYRATMANGLSFESILPVKFIIQDFAGDPDLIAFLTLEWCKTHQSELLTNFENNKQAIKVNLEMLDNDKVDLMFELNLSERVIVKNTGNGNFSFDYPAEPIYTKAEPAQDCQLLDENGNILATWKVAPQAENYALDMPYRSKQP